MLRLSDAAGCFVLGPRQRVQTGSHVWRLETQSMLRYKLRAASLKQTKNKTRKKEVGGGVLCELSQSDATVYILPWVGWWLRAKLHISCAAVTQRGPAAPTW